MGYSKHTLVGISWMSAYRMLTRFISFARTAIIARILSPAQFGLFGIASLTLVLIEVITETGINIFIIQEKEDIEKYINTAWIVSILRGIIISLILAFSSSFIANFYNSREAYYLLLLASVIPLIRGFINPAVAKFQKELQFSKEFYYRSSIFFVESLTSVIFVLTIRSPISLIWGLIAGALFELTISFILSKPIPKFVFQINLMKNVLSRGKWVTISGIFSYLFQNGDHIVVGKMIGVSALGVYDMAYRISMLPITEIADVISKVTFPIYVKISDDSRRLKLAFLKTILVVSALCIPVGAILVLFSKQIITIILGAKWIEASAALQILAIFGVIRSITGISSALFLAVKKQEYSMIVTFVSFITLAVSIIPLVNTFGLIGAGFSAVIGSVAAIPVSIYYINKIFKKN